MAKLVAGRKPGLVADAVGVPPAIIASGSAKAVVASTPIRRRREPREDRAEAVMTNPFASSVQAREASPDGQPETPATG